MQYLLLIYGNEEYFGKLTEAEQGGIMKEYGDFTRSIAQSGHYRGGHELAAISTATTVRTRDKKQLVTDGPFAETKEQLGGYYLIEAKDLDDALVVAERTYRRALALTSNEASRSFLSRRSAEVEAKS